MNDATAEFIAPICYQANKAWCEANRDYSFQHWKDAPQWQKDTVINGVQFKLDNPDSTSEDSHNNWMKVKVDNGWVYGEVKDADKKTHPCLVDYKDLPEFQKKKDALFQAIVVALVFQAIVH